MPNLFLKKASHAGLLFAAVLSLLACTDHDAEQTAARATTPIKVKVVLVTMFERGADSGDAPGEFQLWYERRHLDEIYSFQGEHELHLNAADGILAIVTGAGTAKAAASVMALGMDPRFDLSSSYWLVVGIAGFDPEDASIGSAAWAEYLVDGDLSHEIDAREIPADWQWGYIARHTKIPFDPNRPEPRGEVFRINASLTEWAYQLSKETSLPDNEAVAAARAAYSNHPNARKPPFVLKGDNLADKDRLMVLRTASNYTMPPPGVTAAEHLLQENEGYTGIDLAVETAYIVGSIVVDDILANWATYEQQIPAVSP